VVGVDRPANANVGSTSAIASAAFSGTFKVNANCIVDGVFVNGVAIFRCVVTMAGTTIAGEVCILEGSMLLSADRPACTVRVARFADCVAELVVSPVARVMVQCVFAIKVALAAVNVTEAVELPESLDEAVNVVVAHPLDVGDDNVDNVEFGITSLTVSPAYRGTLRANVKLICDGMLVTGAVRVK
jgi:hypothetical protein